MATPGKAITPKKTKETKKPTTKPPPPKKTHQSKNPITKKTHQTKKPSTKKSKTTNNGNGNVSDSDVVELEVVPSSSSSESRGDSEANGGKFAKTPTLKSKKSNQKRKRTEEEEEVEEEEVVSYTFPMERVRRIIRSQDSDLRISQDAVFLVNKATERFLGKFSEDAHACCMKDRKKSLAYKHLASVVAKRKRYDFLSDYVPEKVKAEDALAKRKSTESKAR